MVAETKIGVGGAWKAMDSIQVGVGSPTVGGGTAPFSYQWALVSGNNSLISNSSLTGSTLTLTLSDDGVQTQSETWKVTVTDSTSTPKVTASGNCAVTLQIDE